MKISFHGAARGVTGSCFLVECRGRRLLVDCGLYQGGDSRDDENAAPFGFDPAEIDYVLLTHAHLDHCGRLPLLVKGGFDGGIVATTGTRDLAHLVLLDAAQLQQEAARRDARRDARRSGKRKAARPLYSIPDVLECMGLFQRGVSYGEPMELMAGVTVTFLDAGHILGSSVILLELREGTRHLRVLFSGDLGSSGRPLICDPAPPPDADVVVMETTYGDRLHKPLDESVEELYGAINDTFQRGGNVIIPTFALARAQELLVFLRRGLEQKKFPASTQVYLDSPMAITATEIYQRHPEFFDAQAAALVRKGVKPCLFDNLHFTSDRYESMNLNRIHGGAIILAGAGMCNGGRVVHHLKNNLWRQEAGIVFVSFAAAGTLARRIIDGGKVVTVLGEEIPVNANIHTINGFSAHADRRELADWHARTGGPERTFLVHGEPRSMEAFAAGLENTEVILPTLHQDFSL